MNVFYSPMEANNLKGAAFEGESGEIAGYDMVQKVIFFELSRINIDS